MKTHYKITLNTKETFIIRKVYGEDTGTKYWIANGCNTLNECSDDNSCCVSFSTKKQLVNWLKSF